MDCLKTVAVYVAWGVFGGVAFFAFFVSVAGVAVLAEDAGGKVAALAAVLVYCGIVIGGAIGIATCIENRRLLRRPDFSNPTI